jgi:hypothetical protein
MRRVLGLFAGGDLGRRALLFALSAAAALYAGYFAIPPIQAGHLIINCGYYYILGVFSLFVYYALRLARSRREVWRGWIARPGAAGAAIAAGTAFGVWSDSFKHKILYDEFVIQGTAYVMHATKQVSTILRAYNIFGTWLPIDFYLDKRPYFFPFLVSLLHDLTGYRVANMFALNVACAAALLGLLYWFTRELAGRAAALFAVALFALMPLFGQNATGAGMDLHNLTMVALVASLGVLYLRVPSDDRLSLFVLGAVLLTQSRYESILFVAPTALVIAAGWMRAGRAVLPWPAVAAPLLLVPYAWHSRVLASEPVFWQLEKGQTSAFGWANVSSNFQGDATFLFNTGPGLANSAYLTVVGLLGLAWFLWCASRWLLSRPRPALPAPVLVGAAFGGGIAVHFGVLLFYWWAKFNDLMAARFALPMCLAFAVLAAVLVRALADRRLPAFRVAWVGLGFWLLTMGMPAIAVKFYTDENLGMQELDWEHSFVESRPGPVLVISNKSTIPFLLWHIEVLLGPVAALKGDEIRYHMGLGTFREVIVAQAVRPTSGEGGMGVDPDDLLPPTFHLQTIAEKRFGGRLDRLSRIVSIDPAPSGDKKPAGKPQPPSPLRSISALHSLSDPPVAALTSSAESR